MQDAMGYPVMSTEEDAANLNLGLQSEVRVGGKVLVEVEMRQADVVDKINQMQEKKSRSRQSSNASATLEQVKKLRERSSTLESSIPEEREVKHVESIVPDSPPRAIKIDKDTFVDGLVGTTVLAIQSIWPGNESSKQASPTSSPSSGSDPVLPLRWFIKEVLRRSRTTCSVLQTALYYLHKSRRSIRDRVVKADKPPMTLLKS
ncbi:hypothetical protein BT69DRAFT_1083754 [Atractiella rhizophila]|nr:hypothetical protein BT69DRAFT_1083754 [Atractiella rhizophila]